MNEETKVRYGHPNFYKYLDEMAETHSVKNHDYSSDTDPLSNFKEVAAQTGLRPFDVVHMQMANKMARIKQLSTKENLVVGEGIIDSIMDLAVYCVLARLILEEDKKEA